MRAFVLLAVLAACAGDAKSTDSATESGTPDSTPTGACTALSGGDWSWNGTCFGMLMSSTVDLEADECAFTIGNWDMAMSAPDGGSVAGDEVTLDWSGMSDCTGTTDGQSMEGTCGDGCTWTATFEG